MLLRLVSSQRLGNFRFLGNEINKSNHNNGFAQTGSDLQVKTKTDRPAAQAKSRYRASNA